LDTKAETLCEILENSPLAIRPMIRMYKQLQGNSYFVLECKGLVREFTFPYKGIMMRNKGIGLSYECDNMPKTLTHEGLHIMYPAKEEDEIERLTEVYHNIPKVRELSRKLIVEKLGEYDL